MVLLAALSASPTFFIGTVLVVGLLVGSFLNVVIYRVPVMLERDWQEQCAQLGQSPDAANATPPPPRFNLIVPRSACPKCHAPITALQNIPVVSYLWLRGRCASWLTRWSRVSMFTGNVGSSAATVVRTQRASAARSAGPLRMAVAVRPKGSGECLRTA